jgi:hypothetical protein
MLIFIICETFIFSNVGTCSSNSNSSTNALYFILRITLSRPIYIYRTVSSYVYVVFCIVLFIMCLYVLSFVLWCPLWFPHKNCVRFIFTPQLFVGGPMSYIRYLCLFAYSGVQHILCCGFLRILYPLLSVSLDCPFLIAPSVFSIIYVHQSYAL